MEEKSKPITGMRRNELVDVRGWRRVEEEEVEEVRGVRVELTYLRLQL